MNVRKWWHPYMQLVKFTSQNITAIQHTGRKFVRKSTGKKNLLPGDFLKSTYKRMNVRKWWNPYMQLVKFTSQNITAIQHTGRKFIRKSTGKKNLLPGDFLKSTYKCMNVRKWWHPYMQLVKFTSQNITAIQHTEKKFVRKSTGKNWKSVASIDL
jgi:hypothetical protein